MDLLTDQIEFADVLILDKANATPAPKLEATRAILRRLHADARILEAGFSEVPPDAIMGTGLFDFERAHDHPMWAKGLYGPADHVPETEDYGVTFRLYRARPPFDPVKIHAVLNGPVPGVIRAKGHFLLATRPGWVAEFSLAGVLSSVSPLGTWWVTISAAQRPGHPQARADLERHWQGPRASGGRRSCASARGSIGPRFRPGSMRASSPNPAPCPIRSPFGAGKAKRPERHGSRPFARRAGQLPRVPLRAVRRIPFGFLKARSGSIRRRRPAGALQGAAGSRHSGSSQW